jgi:hypothetical protein
MKSLWKEKPTKHNPNKRMQSDKVTALIFILSPKETLVKPW